MKRLVIVGGVAGGASAAARARRLCEDCEIVVFERGPHVSFANCGLPYFVGGEIAEADALLVQTPESLRGRFNLDVRVQTEVLAIDRAARELRVRELTNGHEYQQGYDALVLSTGASPLKPPIPGIDPINLAGMAAQNALAGDVALAQWHELATLDPAHTILLDVRQAEERTKGFIPGSIHIPLDQLRARLAELPQDHEIIAHCQTGQRSYYACRLLGQRGYRARNLTGSWRTWNNQPQ